MENPPLGSDAEKQDLSELLSLFDAPAYIRRAREVEQVWEEMQQRLAQRREEWLTMPRLRLGQLAALAPGWERLDGMLADRKQASVLEQLHSELKPRLRAPLEPTNSKRVLRNALFELIQSIERFNRRWHSYLETIDLQPLNNLREGYNKHYVIEKACALRSEVLARAGFRPLSPIRLEDLIQRFPLLEVPKLVRGKT